ncbi:hypothetical protein Purlil1_9722 [Purpureocillium lilacinum]|uniref:Uncharacterized protein n=1 Tax=Purpureocillium lilacinum TaxID=33203 RepID=A0ABR0BPW5_PURLI|nr:hypothetical protein Purlil1_9722 [Purpureocillium lilacinum]
MQFTPTLDVLGDGGGYGSALEPRSCLAELQPIEHLRRQTAPHRPLAWRGAFAFALDMYEAEEKLWEHSPMYAHGSKRVTPDIKNDQPLALLGRFHFVLQQSRRYDAHAYIKITIPSTSSEEIPLSIVPKKTGQSRVRGILLERDNLIGVPWWGEANFAHEGCIKANSSADLNKWGAGATVARQIPDLEFPEGYPFESGAPQILFLLLHMMMRPEHYALFARLRFTIYHGV